MLGNFVRQNQPCEISTGVKYGPVARRLMKNTGNKKTKTNPKPKLLLNYY